jgi:hypothetical protein
VDLDSTPKYANKKKRKQVLKTLGFVPMHNLKYFLWTKSNLQTLELDPFTCRKLNGNVSFVIKFDSDGKFKNVFLVASREEAG